MTAADHEEIHAELIQHNTERAGFCSRIITHQEAIKKFKSDVESLNGRIYANIARLESGEKTVDMECWKITDYSASLVRYVSQNSGELVKERPLNDDEKQMSMDFNDKSEEEITMVSDESSPDAHPDDCQPDKALEPRPPLQFSQERKSANA